MSLESFGKSVESISEALKNPLQALKGSLENLNQTILEPLRNMFDISKWFGANGSPGLFSSFTNMLSDVTDKFQGNETMKSGFSYPLLGRGTFTSDFGMRNGRKHKGVDIAAPIGTKVAAWASGKVLATGFDPGGYGNYIYLEHTDGRKTRYGHLSKIGVQQGQTVQVGQHIGDVGSTGRSSGPHLHFEIRDKDDKEQNPVHVCQQECGINLRKGSA